MKKKLRLRRRQPTVLGGRQPLPACVLKEIRFEISRLALENNVSRSWVVSKILADALRIKKQPSYLEADSKKRRRVS